MKFLKLQNKSSLKVSRGERELSENDIFELSKGIRPGEWVIVVDIQTQRNYVAYVNPHSLSFYKIKIVKEDNEKQFNINSNEEDVACKIIIDQLNASFKKRDLFFQYENGCRLVYGVNDCLPGLIIDKYKKYILIQINTAGMDRFRDLIKGEVVKSFPAHQAFLFDNVEYRKAEVLPVFEEEKISEDLLVVENGLHYKISHQTMQKIGYYYDHRENRAKLVSLLKRTNFSFEKGLDLFCYVGSWGLHMLSAGVRHVDFVDQANMEKLVNDHLEINSYVGQGHFFRADVFKFIDEAISSQKKYDIIVSDPPAFTKSEKNKIAAIQGYEKLHTKVMKILNDNAILVVASCTHHVGFDELDKTVQDAAIKNNQRIQLLDTGVQGFDHPFSGFRDKGFYIKYLVYFVCRG